MRLAERVYFGIVAGIMLFLAMVAITHAQEAPVMEEGLTWSAPTQYTDGSPIAPGELEQMNLYCGTDPQTMPQDIYIAPDRTHMDKADLIAQFDIRLNTTYYCLMTATTTNGLTSDFSEAVSFIVPDNRVPESPRINVH